MIDLTYSGDNYFKSQENIKNNLFKIFIMYCTLSLIFFTLLNISEVRLFIL